MQRLEALGIHPKKRVFWNTVSPVLVEHTLLRGEGLLAHHGPLVVDTTLHGEKPQGQVRGAGAGGGRGDLVGRGEPTLRPGGL